MDLVKEEEELMKHTCNNPPDSIRARAPFKPDSSVHTAHELLLSTSRQGIKFRIDKTLLR